MPYAHTVRGERFTFPDLRDLFAKANEPKSGDELAGLAARSERERAAAKFALADVPLGEIADNPVIDPDDDDVFIPAIKDPQDLQLIVAGGWGPCTAVCHGWSGGSRAVHGTYRCD